MGIKEILRKSNTIRYLQYVIYKICIFFIGEKKWIEKRYKRKTGKIIDLGDPKTLNEKIVWLKLYYYNEFYQKCCDKYLIHEYLQEKLGKDYAVPMIYATRKISELKNEKIKSFPCIIKVSNGQGTNLIVNSVKDYSDKYLQKLFRNYILTSNVGVLSNREHQYLDKNPYIVVEKLITNNGEIPNDYKFLYINGKLQFIYCSVDRKGENIRQIYDNNWNRLHFIWVKGANKRIYDKYEKSKAIPRPKNYEKMKEISEKIACDFPIVRIDFYDVDDEIYIGEITLHHGSGEDLFFPSIKDEEYGEKLILPEPNRKVR